MKRIIPYILILSVIMGIFSPVLNVQASQTNPEEACVYGPYGIIQNRPCKEANPGSTAVPGNAGADPTAVVCTGKDASGTPTPSGCNPNNTVDPEKEALKESLTACASLFEGTLVGCVEHIVYFFFVTIPSFLMAVAAHIFDFMAGISISSNVYKLDFVQKLWVIVRDFANIFFILILLYAAFEIILDLGHGSAKKIVASVILMALVVNFSLFFTKIIIDSSNVVALIFYNRIDTTNTNYTKISDPNKTGVVEKDLAGSLISRFNVNSFFTPEFLGKLDTAPTTSRGTLSGIIEGATVGATVGFEAGGIGALPGAAIGAVGGAFIPKQTMEISVYALVSMMVLYGITIYALTYAFFVAAMSFIGRMLTLIMLMIVSPFAFVSRAVPSFSHINTIGFDSWFKKLIETSFVAAIFMFILYVISEILKANIFAGFADTTASTTIWSKMIMLFVPPLLIVILLVKGAKYAQKASGEFTGAAMTVGKMVGGFAVGAATGGAAVLGRASIGRAGSWAANSEWAKKREAEGKFGSAMTRDLFKAAGSGSFDLRGVKVGGKSLASSGLRVGGAQTGGFTERRTAQVAKRQARAKELEVSEDEGLKQALNTTDADLHDLKGEYAKELENLDKELEDKRRDLKDASAAYAPNSAQVKKADRELQNAKDRKTALRSGQFYAGDIGEDGNVIPTTLKDYSDAKRGTYTYIDANDNEVTIDRTIKNMETIELVNRKHDIERENRTRAHQYAESIQKPLEHAKQFFLTGLQYSPRGAKEAAIKIMTHAQVPKGGGKFKAEPDYPKGGAAHDDHSGGDAHAGADNHAAADSHGPAH